MKAARLFASELATCGDLGKTSSVIVSMYGSIGATGRGHGSDKAVVAGLAGNAPEVADPSEIAALVESVRASKKLVLMGGHEIAFDPARCLKFSRSTLGYHSNGLTFVAKDESGEELTKRTYFSIGGGFVVDESAEGDERLVPDTTELPYPFASGDELLSVCEESGLSISTLMLKNEMVWRPEAEVRSRLLEIWAVMQACVERGCEEEGILPGGLKVKRRAAPMFRKLQSESSGPMGAPSRMDWVNLWALAVNEENAAGGRVVTAPTNGAAGIIPAILHYYVNYCKGASDDGVVRFLLAAAAIGTLFKKNASISGAEVGCQGEVGSACSMAAAGLAEVLGGTPEQVENAAEIGMEHNLGLTCDPIGGLVQVPCIERNAMGAVKAINATRLALRGDGKHFVSLDKVIRTMRDTGRDMKTKYKETARGGLAVNVIEC